MATTVPGGRYLSPDKKTWHDANGNAVDGPTPGEDVAKASLPQVNVGGSPPVNSTEGMGMAGSSNQPPAGADAKDKGAKDKGANK